MDNEPRKTATTAGCVCPFDFSGGVKGYCVYDDKGVRTDKQKLKDGETIQSVASKLGMMAKMFPPSVKVK